MNVHAEVTIGITPWIPWWFGLIVVVASLFTVIGLVQLVGDALAQSRIKNHRELQNRPRGRQTLLALGLGVIAALVAGLNVQNAWYLVNPELQRPDQNVVQVRDEFAQQGVENLELRDTDPPNSLVLIDEEAWNAGQPLELLLSCDAGQHPSAGHYPAYEDFNWDLPVQYLSDGTSVEAMIERTVSADDCTFEVAPV